MKDSEGRRQSLSLTMMFAGLAFCFLLLTMIVVSVLIIVLTRIGLLRLGAGSTRIGTFVLLVALTSIVIGTLLSATAGRIPLRSVNEAINALNRLAAGDFKTRLNYSGPLANTPVVKELTSSFNKMAAELESTEMLRADFINNFSHEFKTPIVSIAGFAKLLKRGNLTPEEQREYLDIIEDESLRLSAMATNVLNMTKVENQTILTDVTSYNLSEQLRNCVLLLESKWMKKNLDLNIDFDEHTIDANEEMMKEVWVNLLDNAIKFSPEDGLVEAAIYEDTESISVSVINSGSEIPRDKQDRLFQKFYQADESHATEGSGIGLSIAHKIVELHGGRINVDSRKGRTAFTVILPKRKT